MIKRELNIRLIYECQCDERLKAKAEGYIHWVTRGTGTPKDRDEVGECLLILVCLFVSE